MTWTYINVIVIFLDEHIYSGVGVIDDTLAF